MQPNQAIYVDFECLQTKPPRPALLGVLTDTEPFEQIIVDERLAPGKVANTRLRVLRPEVAASELVSRAIAENRLIVGWSYFDRDRLTDAAPALAPQIDARYVNALHVARPWRRALHPRFAIKPEDPFAPKYSARQVRAPGRLSGFGKAPGGDACSVDQAHSGATSRCCWPLSRDHSSDQAGLAPSSQLQPPRLLGPAAHRPESGARTRMLALTSGTRFLRR